MDRDTTVLLALISLAAAAAVVGVSGWVLFARDHRAWREVHAHASGDGAHPEGAGEG